MAKDRFEGMSAQGREALDQGFNPRSLSDEDYAVYLEAHSGDDPVASPVDSAEDDSGEGGE